MLTTAPNYDALPAAGAPGMIDAFYIDTLHKKSMKTVRQSFGSSVEHVLRSFAKRFALVTFTGSGMSTMAIGNIEDLTAELRACAQRAVPQGFTLSITVLTDSATGAGINVAVLGVQR